MKKKEPISDYLRRCLAASRGQHNRISKETGVPQSTIARINSGDCSPRISTVQPLIDWFEKNGLKSQPKKRSAVRLADAKGGAVKRATRSAAPALSE